MIQQARKMIRVLIVEDSPTTALGVRNILNSDPAIAILSIAKDGREAVDMARRLRPDVITMDFNIPVMDGLEATRQIMATAPVPILILSNAVFSAQVAKGFAAISYGAVDLMNKDEVLSHPAGKSPNPLIEKIKFLSRVKVITHPMAGLRARRNVGVFKGDQAEWGARRVVAIIASTGGPHAVGSILQEIPKEFPCGVLVLIHLAKGFHEGYVQWLQGFCPTEIKVAKAGERIRPGVAYVAPSELHMRVAAGQIIDMGDDPPKTGLKPCGDYLLESVAREYEKGAIGVLLTGMGKDGARGMAQIKAYGGKSIAQDEKTCAIFGMPKAAIEMNVIDKILPLDAIAREIASLIKVGVKW